MESFESKLLSRIKGARKIKIVLMAIGNEYRHDDGVARTIINKLHDVNNPSTLIMDCKEVPENFTGLVKGFNPTHIILIDSADFKAKTGAFDIFDVHDIESARVTTHRPSLTTIADYLLKETSATIFMIGVQPADTSFGIGLSGEVETAADSIVEVLRTVLSRLDA